MPFESKPISVEKIEGYIKDKQESSRIEFDELEKDIVSKILDELPNSFNTGSLTKFCKNKVDIILAACPEKKERADLIRNHVQKEIIFDLYNDRFIEVLEAIKIGKPEKISPQWIRERFPSTSLLIRRTIKDNHNNVDWDFFADKLNIKDIFIYQEKKFWNEAEAIDELKRLLEKEKPDTFSPIWIEKNNDSLHTFFKMHFQNDDGTIDWDKIVDHLGKEWKDKWTYRESERNRHLDDVLDKVCYVLKEKNPESFSPSWLFANCNKEYEFLKKKIRNTNGEICWGIIVDLLPLELKNKWEATIRDRNWNYNLAINQLKELINNENPETFNSSWLESKDKGLYMYFLRNIRNTTGIDWKKILNTLPEELQDKWRVRSKNINKSTFNQAMIDLKEIIKQKNPKIITSGFIGRENSKLLSYFTKNIKDDNGEVDWRIVINRLDAESKKICRFPKKLEQYKPTNEYINEEEVDLIINNHKDKLYTFFEILNPEDFQHRDKICLDFLRLVQKGNVLAKEKILDYLEILVTQWVENEEKLKIFIAHGDLLRERIQKCIYYYNSEDGSSFFKYLHTSLMLEGKGLQIPKYIRLNQEYKDSGETIESRMNLSKE